MKKLIALMLLTGLLACQEPGVQPLPPESKPTSQPSATAIPTESPEPEPSQTPEPEPTPVQRLEVIDITPKIFQLNGSRYSALTLSPQTKDVFFTYSGNVPEHLGIWRTSGDGHTKKIIPGGIKEFDSIQYHADSLYTVNVNTDKKICLKQYEINKAPVRKNEFCFDGDYDFNYLYPVLKVNNSGAIFVFVHLNKGQLYRFLRGFKLNDYKNPDIILTSNPIGVDKILFGGLYGECLGVCSIWDDNGIDSTNTNSSSVTWIDQSTSTFYGVNKLQPSISVEVIINNDVKSSVLIPIIKDGTPQEVTLWRPSGLESDRHDNLYVLERPTWNRESLIRQIKSDGTTSTLISANGLTAFGYPEFKASLKSILPAYKQSDEITDSIREFSVDYINDWLYIQSEHLYRFDLRTEELELLALTHLPDSDIKVNQLGNLNIDSAGNLYATYGSRILKILIPQPEGR